MLLCLILLCISCWRVLLFGFSFFYLCAFYKRVFSFCWRCNSIWSIDFFCCNWIFLYIYDVWLFTKASAGGLTFIAFQNILAFPGAFSSFFGTALPRPIFDTFGIASGGIPGFNCATPGAPMLEVPECPSFLEEDAFHFKRIFEKSSHLISSLLTCFALLGILNASSKDVSPALFVVSLKIVVYFE